MIFLNMRITATVLAVVFAIGCSVTPALASPASEIKDARAKAAAAAATLDDLSADLEERNEDYLEITDALARTRAEASQTQRELDRARMELEAARIQLTARVNSIYRNGNLSLIDVLIGATDFEDLVTRVDLMRRVGLSDAAIVAQVEVAREDLDRSSRALEIRKDELTALRLQATAKREAVASALEAQTSYLARMNAKLKTLIADERERQKRIAAEKAAALAAAKTSGPVTAGGRSFDPDALKGAHPNAVDIARRFVDKTPYLWGGTTPAGFDCSGLVQYCYREIGINLPRTSRQQYLVGSFIPANRLDLLQPGDLVFFGRDGDPGRIHHVGMYIGSGNMIHAPQTGELVTVASLVTRIESRGDYVGACRP